MEKKDESTSRGELPGTEVRLPDLPNKNIRHTVKFESQINNK